MRHLMLVIVLLIALLASWTARAEDSDCMPPDVFVMLIQMRAPGVSVERLSGQDAQAMIEVVNDTGNVPHSLAADELLIFSGPASGSVLMSAFENGCRTWSATIPSPMYRELKKAAIGDPA